MRAVEKTLARVRDFPAHILPPALTEAEAVSQGDFPRLFILDSCSLRADLGRLAGRCRASSPGSKFLVLLSPGSKSLDEITRLFYWGIDGFVELHRTWQTELPLAIQNILKGQLASRCTASSGPFSDCARVASAPIAHAPSDEQRDFQCAQHLGAHREVSRFKYSQQVATSGQTWFITRKVCAQYNPLWGLNHEFNSSDASKLGSDSDNFNSLELDGQHAIHSPG
jgi:hypothetical protein